VTDERLKELLRDAPLPDEDEARERSWRVVQAAYEQRSASGAPARRNRRLGLALAGAAAVLAIALSPAGAKVGDVIRDVAGIGGHKAAPSLTSLPAQGRLLVDSPVGPWVVQDDGAKRLLGDYDQATWSPSGLYVGVTGGRELAAVEPDGTLHWTLDRPHSVHDPRWSASGFRVAYRSGSSLRVVAGDGTGDHLLARHAAPVAVAWKPLSGNAAASASRGLAVDEIAAFMTASGRMVVENVDTGMVELSLKPRGRPSQLAWSSDGKLLLAAGEHRLSTYAPGRKAHPLPAGYGPGASIGAAVFLPGTHRIAAAVNLHRGTQRVIGQVRTDARSFFSKRLAARRGRITDLVPSPDGRWLLAAQPQDDRWLFVRVRDGKVKTAADIAAQFDPGATGPVAFPRIDGWCCGP
jgi:hypothetical protein